MGRMNFRETTWKQRVSTRDTAGKEAAADSGRQNRETPEKDEGSSTATAMPEGPRRTPTLVGRDQTGTAKFSKLYCDVK